MLFMVIGRFKDRDGKSVYRTFRDKGRMMPEGMSFVASWTEASLERCFVVIECDDAGVLQDWADNWHGLADFEFVPVVEGKQTAEILKDKL